MDDLDTATRLPVALAACQAAFEAAGTARPLLEPAARHLVARAARAARTAWAFAAPNVKLERGVRQGEK